MLRSQALYGTQSAQDDDGPLALGRNLFPILPEDTYDTGRLAQDGYRFVADARLDNRPELAAKLEIGHAERRFLSDAALLFRALCAWGERAVAQIAGEFAFALWDGRKQELLLGRDILGLRPLCFHRGKHFFAFASMPSGLHALNDVPYEVDSQFLLEQLALLPRIGSRTCFKGIERVEPGNLVRVTRNATHSSAYWEPPAASGRRGSPAEYEEGLRSVFDDAVSAQLRGAGKTVATQLSGGLDSSTVTATVARIHSPEKVVAYTAVPRQGFDGPSPPGTIANEAELAAATARLYQNIQHVLVPGAGQSPLSWLDENFHYQQQPMAILQNAEWGQAIHQAAHSAGASIIFKASLGNLTISYAGLELLPLLASRGRLLTLLGHIRALGSEGMPAASIAARTVGPFIPHQIWSLIRRSLRKSGGPNSLSAADASALAAVHGSNRRPDAHLAQRPLTHPWRTRVETLRRIDGGNAFKGVLAEWGLSVRDPTADKRVIEYCLSVPYEEFLRGGRTRSLARRAFSDRLPPEVTDSRMRGFQSADWYEALDRARAQIEEQVHAIANCPGAGEVISIEWLNKAISEWPTGDWNDAKIRARYRLTLLRALSTGHFIRRVRGAG